MDACPFEILALITDLAELDDPYRSSCTLSAVSKHFYTIVGPFRFRRLRISGLKQLEEILGAVERTISISDHQHIRIIHLFICNYTREHALAKDTHVQGSSKSFNAKEAERDLEIMYYDQHPRFWDKASRLLRVASYTLQTLTILDYSSFPDPVRFYNQKFTAFDDVRLLYALSSVDSFPQLSSLVIKHDIRRGETIFGGTDSWKRPDMPILAKLTLKAQVLVGRNAQYVHPLLHNIHSDIHNLGHLSIPTSKYTFMNLVAAICGVSPSEARQNNDNLENSEMRMKECVTQRKLPGSLRTVELHLGRTPIQSGGTGFSSLLFHDQLEEVYQTMKTMAFPGMVVVPMTPAFPVAGEREYELILSEWEIDCKRR